MAKTNDTQPLADLREEAVDHLNAIGVELDEAEKDLAALTELGMDVSRLQERVNWGRKARKVILERYGKKA